MRLMAKIEYLIVSKGMKFEGSGKLGLIMFLYKKCIFSTLLDMMIRFLKIPIVSYLMNKYLFIKQKCIFLLF